MDATPNPITLAVDCGGGGIKSCILDASGSQCSDVVRTQVPYPFSPEDLLKVIEHQLTEMGSPHIDRTTLGMPGMIRHGVVVYTPHYIRRAGPHTRVLPNLEHVWTGQDMQGALEARFGVPALVLNDAEVAAADIATGKGLELVLTLGTGLGSAFLDNGLLAPHLEISHATVRWGLTYDDILGEHERVRLGDAAWSRRVLKAIETLWPVFRWDTLYIGGGNASRVTDSVRARMPEVTWVANMAGMAGGVRAWAMVGR
ncbi:ROK family protein [Trueperella pyogenes]|uniref:ROK family protein n=1 Tax=Trueperella pyogenes TaxID=1661 RepID=UPI0032442B4D